MGEAGRSLLQDPAKPRRLADAMREVKNNAADRVDVIADMREASRTRLELLAHELEGVFAEVPADDPSFDFVISSGEQPRLWIDAVAHVMLGRDRRTYRFVRDTRMGRVVMIESPDLQPVVDKITLYIAERMVERQRMIEGDVEALPRAAPNAAEPASTKEPRQGSSAWLGFLCLLLGALTGAVAVIAMYPQRFPEILQFLRSLA